MPPADSTRLDALTNAFNQLLQNQDRLEQRLAYLEEALAARGKPLAPVLPLEPPVFIAKEAIPPEPPMRAADPSPVTPPFAASEESGRSSFESKVGLTVVNRIGVLTLVLGVAFFFKWAADNNWIGPAGRVMLGLLAGFASLAAGDFVWRKRQAVFAQGVTATGVAILYLAVYAAFNFYQLIPQTAAFGMMVATTALTAALAVRYRSLAIAALSLVAGYLTPLLLSTDQDHPWFLFGYLLLLNFAATELARRAGWAQLEFISFVATALIYGGWLLGRGERAENHLVGTLAALAFCAQRARTQTPLLFSFSQLLAAIALADLWQNAQAPFFSLSLLTAAGGLIFAQARAYRLAALTAFSGYWVACLLHVASPAPEALAQYSGVTSGFLLFFGWNWWQLAIRRAAPTTQALAMVALNGILYYVSSYYLLNTGYRAWLGPLAAAVAASYLAFGLFLKQREDEQASDARPMLLAFGVAVGFLTLAIPIQFTGFTITIAWAMQAAALAWIAQRLASARTLLAVMVLLGLVVIRLGLIEASTLADPHSYGLLANSRFLTFAVSATAMLLAAAWGAKLISPAALAAYSAGHIVLLWGLCLEIDGWARRSITSENRLSAETIAISILFGLYAVLLVSAGVATRSVVNRLAGLALTGVVILKLYFFDVWQLSRPYQISAFVVLGILLLSTSFLYSRFRRLIESWWKDEHLKNALLSVLLFGGLVRADFIAEMWRYRRPLSLPGRAPLAEFRVDSTLYRSSTANLDDLRLLRDGLETPYLIRSLNATRRTFERPAAILNKDWVAGRGVQAVLDLKNRAGHNRLRIATALHNFKEDVVVETSDDGRNWAVAQADGLIFDVQRDEHVASETTVSYPYSTRRFLRLTIRGWTNPAALAGVWLSDFEEADTVRDVVATLAPAVREDAKAETSELLVDLGAAGQPYDRIELSADPGLFSRTVEIASSNDGQHWFSTAGGVIFRTADGEHLWLENGERTSRYLKITVFNGDSAPLHFGRLTLSGVRRVVQFPATAPGAYVVYVGNAGARPPTYDFANVMPSKITPAEATLGTLAANPLFRAPERPWTDRHPALLNGALIVAVLLMGVISLRMLGKTKSP